MMLRARICTFKGCEIRIDPLFAVVLAVSMLSGYIGAFLCAFLCVLLHEAAHAAVGKSLLYAPRELTIMPFGAVVGLGMENCTAAEEASVAIAGPIVNLALSALAYGACYFLKTPPAWLRMAGDVNAAITVLNLMPVLPLDGGRVVRALAAKKLGYRRATRLAGIAGAVFGAALTLAGVFFSLRGRVLVSVILMGAFIVIGALMEMRSSRSAQSFVAPMLERPLPVRTFAAKDTLPAVRMLKLFEKGEACLVRVVDSQGRYMGELSAGEITEALCGGNTDMTLHDALRVRR